MSVPAADLAALDESSHPMFGQCIPLDSLRLKLAYNTIVGCHGSFPAFLADNSTNNEEAAC